MVSPAVTLNICFYFSLCSIPFRRNCFGILWMRYTAVGTASSVRLFLPITLSSKGRICRKYTSSRRIKRDSRPLHLIKPNRYDRERSRESGHGEAIRGRTGKLYKRGKEYYKGIVAPRTPDDTSVPSINGYGRRQTGTKIPLSGNHYRTEGKVKYEMN